MKNGICRMKSGDNKKENSLSERFLDFAADIIRLVLRLKNDEVGRLVRKQLTGSDTSSGANYEESCGAESRADFIHKMQIVLKELKESTYWLKLIERAELISRSDPLLLKLIQESVELSNIIAKSIITARKNK